MKKLWVILLATAIFSAQVRTARSGVLPDASRKRGICYNRLTAAETAALRPGVSWMYNWHYDTDAALKSPSSGIAFYPMVWGNAAGSLEGFGKLARGGFRPEYVLALNEPNLKGQAFLTPEDAAKSYLAIRKEAARHGIKTIGPHMALGSPGNSSITAFDPLEKKETTYTYMIPYLNAFLHFVGGLDQVDAIAVHSYGNIGELRWLVGMVAETYRKPVWLTEFNWWDARDERQALEYLVEAVDLLERSLWVEKYAWFKADMRDGKNSLLTPAGQLTTLGEAYVRMPVIDPDVWHRPPLRLEAAACVRLAGARVQLAAEDDVFLEVHQQEADGWLEFQVEAATASERTLSLRVDGASAVAVTFGETPVATLSPSAATERGLQTLSAPLALPAGRHTLRISSAQPGARFHWVEIK